MSEKKIIGKMPRIIFLLFGGRGYTQQILTSGVGERERENKVRYSAQIPKRLGIWFTSWMEVVVISNVGGYGIGLSTARGCV